MDRLRSQRHIAKISLIVLISAMIVTFPFLSRLLMINPSTTSTNQPFTVPSISGNAGVNDTTTTGTDVISSTGGSIPCPFDIPELDNEGDVLNRGGDVLSHTESDHIDSATLNGSESIQTFSNESSIAYINSEMANLYINPLPDTPSLITLQYGEPVEVTGSSLGWFRVKYQDAQVYIQKSDVTDNLVLLPGTGERFVLATAKEDLQLFAAPSTDAEMLTEIWFADRVIELERVAGWSKIRTDCGFEGYVSSAILTKDIVFVQDSSVMYAIQEIAVYASPSKTSAIVHYYKKNDKILRNGYSFDWSRLTTSDNETGYVLQEDLTKTPPYTAPANVAPKPEPATPKIQYSSATIQKVIDKAMSYVGGRYVLGGTTYSGIDCSGLTMRAYEAIGIKIPHSSYIYWNVGYAVSLADIQPGDIIGYDSEYNGSIGHVAIYIGNGQVVNAMNEQRGVGIGTMYFGGYRIMTVRRIVG